MDLNLFDVLNKLMGKKTTKEIRESNDRAERRKRDAEMRARVARARPQPDKPFVPTPNDPEYYARNGQAKSEAEAQRLVNSYRETQYPGVKPLYDNFAPKTQVNNVQQVVPRPRSDERYKITRSQF